ncbi:MAG: hypothetical protein J6U68_00430 [Clostridia bacterium]|nr:hypothetical protein [Clostridia bacterium]
MNGYLNYEKVIGKIDDYLQKYDFISVTSLCSSASGRRIPIITYGEGQTVIVYVAGEGTDDTTSVSVLLRFFRDICELYKNHGAAYGFSAENIFNKYTIVVLPLINPDKESYPENEIGELRNFLKFGAAPNMVLSFSSSSDEEGRILFGEGERDAKMARALAQMSGLRRCFSETKEPRLSLKDWAKNELSCSSFSVELPRVQGFSKKNLEDKLFASYAEIRKILFCAPYLNKI